MAAAAAAVALRSLSAAALSRRLSSAPQQRLARSAQLKRLHRAPRFAPAAMSTASGPKEAPANNPGLHTEIDPATKGYFLQQTMLRVKDPKVSLDFYSRVMGMSVTEKDVASAPADHIERTTWTFRQKATLELTHNWGTENDPEFKGYHNGNSDPRGFGHIGVTVDDVYKACERFEQLGVEFVKKPNDGSIKGIAFIKDPDGYWIEIFDHTIGAVTASAS
ncbi:hypothetical protein ACP4OV_030474 [Aristida adscensionis]